MVCGSACFTFRAWWKFQNLSGGLAKHKWGTCTQFNCIPYVIESRKMSVQNVDNVLKFQPLYTKMANREVVVGTVDTSHSSKLQNDTVYTTCLGQPASLGQCTMWPQSMSDLLDNLHACFYIPWVPPWIFTRFINYIWQHSIDFWVFCVKLG